MNRPIKPTVEDDLTFEDYMCACGKWEKDIQEYCDELETHFAKCEQDSNEYIKRLENALDKACDELFMQVYCPTDIPCPKGNEHNCTNCKVEFKSKEQWKEWSMKDGD